MENQKECAICLFTSGDGGESHVWSRLLADVVGDCRSVRY